MTTYWHADGTPLSAQQFVTLLFGKLPALVESEAALRTLWSNTETRAKLLDDLAEVGFGAVQLAEMQKIIDAEQSDLLDVLAYIAHATPRLTRAERAERAKARFKSQFTAKQRTFLDFVLSHYVNEGGQELEPDKLKSLLLLKYHNSIADALADLGDPEELRAVFLGFQKYLYQD